ncbi:hypothetical protein PENSUB_13393 [Penicillium subrubescens]|uniref:Uncharacterized protein n=2 Tax=Penicillium subrubescens TaxID=1316194 RepID=A0A1Q5SRW7_9EURO|nr:hypothetical protein PENSUB_13393 [Penicillium subrubescens]
MAYNYGYTSNSDGWPMWTTNIPAYRSEFIQLYQGAPQNQRNQHQPRQLQDQRLAQQIQWQGLQSEPPFAAFEPMSLLYSSNRQDRGQSAAAYNYPQYIPLQSSEALPEPTFALPYSVSSTTQLELTPVHAQVQVLEQRDEKEPFRSLEEEYAQYGISLCTVFDHIRQGRLIDASRLLLEISK